MRLTWVSGDKEPQQIQYEGKSEKSVVVTFTQDDMCGKSLFSLLPIQMIHYIFCWILY